VCGGHENQPQREDVMHEIFVAAVVVDTDDETGETVRAEV